MFNNAKQLVWSAALLAGSAMPAAAADIYEPPVVDTPPPVYAYEKPASEGGWYLRGDIDYHFPGWRGGDYIVYYPPGTQSFLTGAMRPSFSLGAGVGYQANKWFRADFTGDYWFKSRFRGTTGTACGLTCTDEADMSALVLMANAYADLGTYNRITPYVGAGIGGAWVKWDDLRNTPGGGNPIIHDGASSWRFAWSLMAGASYCINKNWKADLGYRYTRVSGGRMFQMAPGAPGPGFDRGFNVHEARAGLRYQFGGGKDCAPVQEAYVPYEPETVTPVYK